MAILTNPQGRKFYVVRRISTNTVLRRFALYPAAVDDTPIASQDPDIELLAMDRDADPVVNPDYYRIVTTEAKQGGIWKITRTAQKLSVALQKANASRIAESEFLKHFPTGDTQTFVFLCVGALDKDRRGTALAAGETARLNTLQTRYTKILQNAQNLAALFTAIDAGQEPDMRAGWQAP